MKLLLRFSYIFDKPLTQFLRDFIYSLHSKWARFKITRECNDWSFFSQIQINDSPFNLYIIYNIYGLFHEKV